MTVLRLLGRSAVLVLVLAGLAEAQAPPPPGTILTWAGGNPAAPLPRPHDIRFDRAGHAYIIDQDASALWVVEAQTGLIGSIAPPAPFTFTPSAIAIHPSDGSLYFCNQDERIWRYDPASPSVDPILVAGTGVRTGSFGTVGPGGTVDLGDGGQAIAANFATPVWLAFDVDANLFVSDRDNHRVRRIDAATGVITTVAGTGINGVVAGGFADGVAILGELNTLWAITFGPDGSLYIADAGNGRIRRVTPAASGALITSGLGEMMTTVVSGISPFGVAVDRAGRVLFSGDSSHQVSLVEGG